MKNGLRQLGIDGQWEYEPDWDEDGDPAEEPWIAAHPLGDNQYLRPKAPHFKEGW
ncbi:hypothetical protein [Streptomyces sp. NPDC001815]|uniref:hypothetical protein n=1 Tax=Streptomyces sp. NPDC001815 TaxID=3154526 RepID=UPI00332AE88D